MIVADIPQIYWYIRSTGISAAIIENGPPPGLAGLLGWLERARAAPALPVRPGFPARLMRSGGGLATRLLTARGKQASRSSAAPGAGGSQDPVAAGRHRTRVGRAFSVISPFAVRVME
jgi:hypothetical protein